MTGLWVFLTVLVVISLIATGVAYLIAESVVGVVATLVICIIVTGGLTGMNWATTYQNDHWATCTVTGKDRGADDGSYRIYTSDCGVLSNEDSVLRQKFSSADFWQQIPDKGVMQFEIAGVRFGPLSHFPNIFDVKKADS